MKKFFLARNISDKLKYDIYSDNNDEIGSCNLEYKGLPFEQAVMIVEGHNKINFKKEEE